MAAERVHSEEKEIKNLLKASGFKKWFGDDLCSAGLHGITLTILHQNSDPTRQKNKKQGKKRKQDDWQARKRCGKTPGGGRGWPRYKKERSRRKRKDSSAECEKSRDGGTREVRYGKENGNGGWTKEREEKEKKEEEEEVERGAAVV